MVFTEEQEVVDNIKETVFSRCIRAVAHMNSHWLWQLHKICTSSSQIKSQARSGEVDMKPHSKLRTCWHLMVSGKESLFFNDMNWGLSLNKKKPHTQLSSPHQVIIPSIVDLSLIYLCLQSVLQSVLITRRTVLDSSLGGMFLLHLTAKPPSFLSPIKRFRLEILLFYSSLVV